MSERDRLHPAQLGARVGRGSDPLQITTRGRGALVLALLLLAFVAGYLSGPWGVVPVTDAETTGSVTVGEGDK